MNNPQSPQQEAAPTQYAVPATSQWAPAAAQQSAFVPRQAGMNGAMKLLIYGLGTIALLALIGYALGFFTIGTPNDVGIGNRAAQMGRSALSNDTWSFYHDRSYNTAKSGPKWTNDRVRSNDPLEAVLGDTSRWEYDGPYQYGPYGSDGISRRARGREKIDPLYSQQTPLRDVFSSYGGPLDPSGGAPVGSPPSSMTNPYYNPYGGYSNPYANRIRLAFGEGYGLGAAPQ